MEKFDTVIVGAGPGGLRCAKVLADAGKDVLVLERSPEPFRKICTGLWGITPKTEEMNLPEKVFDRKFRQMRLCKDETFRELNAENIFLATLDRKKLSSWQIKEAEKAGAKIWLGSPVQKVTGERVELRDGREIHFKNLVGSDGSYSIVRRSLGLPVKIGIGIQYKIGQKFDCPEIHFDPKSFGPWYAWVAPYKDFTFVGTGADSAWISSGELRTRLDKWCLKRGIDISSAEFEGAPIQYDYQGYRFGNKYLVGDAAGFVSALTGEGIYFAMASGEDVAKTIIDKRHKPLLIQKILGIKRKHELILTVLRSNRKINDIGLSMGFYLLNYDFFKNWLIDLVC
jgi:flavin-dependent dehydrogenase